MMTIPFPYPSPHTVARNDRAMATNVDFALSLQRQRDTLSAASYLATHGDGLDIALRVLTRVNRRRGSAGLAHNAGETPPDMARQREVDLQASGRAHGLSARMSKTRRRAAAALRALQGAESH